MQTVLMKLPIVACLFSMATPAAAQTSPYAGEPARAIAALSDEAVGQAAANGHGGHH